MLDALEAIRIGDPASSLERAVPQCTLNEMEEDYRCESLQDGEVVLAKSSSSHTL